MRLLRRLRAVRWAAHPVLGACLASVAFSWPRVTFQQLACASEADNSAHRRECWAGLRAWGLSGGLGGLAGPHPPERLVGPLGALGPGCGCVVFRVTGTCHIPASLSRALFVTNQSPVSQACLAKQTAPQLPGLCRVLPAPTGSGA